MWRKGGGTRMGTTDPAELLGEKVCGGRGGGGGQGWVPQTLLSCWGRRCVEEGGGGTRMGTTDPTELLGEKVWRKGGGGDKDGDTCVM